MNAGTTGLIAMPAIWSAGMSGASSGRPASYVIPPSLTQSHSAASHHGSDEQMFGAK
jgi:hypothetical protein